MKQSIMRPQDIVVLLKIISLGKNPWMKKDIAEAIDVSPAEITGSLERSRVARLIDGKKKIVYTASLLDFLQYGIKYVFPVIPQVTQRGIGTSVSAPALEGVLTEGKENYVWPTPKGNIRGVGIQPLYKTVPDAAVKDERLYEMLSLVDCFRFGRVREREYAAKRLKTIFDQYNA